MLNLALDVAMGALGLASILTTWSLLRARTLPDRVLALDTLYINAVALLVLVGITRSTTVYFEIALLIAILGFVSTVAFCRYVLRGDLIE